MADQLLTITGGKELVAALRLLPDDVAKNALRAATAAMARVVFKDAVDKAPEETGALKRNIYMKQIREQSMLTRQVYYVGVKAGFARYAKNKKNVRLGIGGRIYKNSGKTFYWRFLEFGTSKMGARPFLRPALYKNLQAATDACAKKLDDRIQATARQMALAARHKAR